MTLPKLRFGSKAGNATRAARRSLALRRHQFDPPVQRSAGIGGVGAHRREESDARGLQPRLRDAKILNQLDRGAGIGAIGDAGDAAFQPPRVGGLAVLEGGPLHPCRVEILHLIARDDAAAEPADAGIIFCAGQSRVWAEAFVVTPSDKASSRKIGLNSMRGKLMGNPFVRETIEGSDGTKYDL